MGLFMGFGGLFLFGGLAILLGIVIWPLGLIFGIVALGFPVFAMLTTRRGSCPNCGHNTIVIRKGKCGSCRHRLVVRGEQILDVT